MSSASSIDLSKAAPPSCWATILNLSLLSPSPSRNPFTRSTQLHLKGNPNCNISSIRMILNHLFSNKLACHIRISSNKLCYKALKVIIYNCSVYIKYRNTCFAYFCQSDVIPAESTGITNTASYPLFATSDNWLSCLFKS